MSLVELPQLVEDFARGLRLADSRLPRSKNWRPGIGPHDEVDVITLVMNELVQLSSERYARHCREVSYPGSSQRCDLGFPDSQPLEWAVEVKALRMLGDKGIVVQGRDDVSRILSPYASQGSAFGDCLKLANSHDLASRRAMLIYAYDFPDYPCEELIDAFELVVGRRVDLGPRAAAPFRQLVHPIHREGYVYGWEIRSRKDLGAAGSRTQLNGEGA